VSRLDDPGILPLDASGMLDKVASLGAELVRAWDAFADFDVPAGAAEASSLVIAGMGGSATAADYFAALCAQCSEIPVSVVRGYSLPNYVSDRTLVVVSSYSGNTEESLACYDDAWKRGATIIAMTTGGKLGERAAADGVSVCTIRYGAAPRAAIAHSLAPLLRLGAAAGFCPVDRPELQQVARAHEALVAEQLSPEVPAAKNPAKQLAESLEGRLPLILGAEHLASVASRFKNQLAENGKTLGAADALPEANHNLIVGLSRPAPAASAMSLITLESGLYNERNRRRFDVTCDLFGEAGIPVHRLRVNGGRPLEQIFLGTAWGDFVSCYAALLGGFDPSPVPQIDRLKAALAQ
jgi:glucose/mannose-6-phosphate isomerase